MPNIFLFSLTLTLL